MKEDGGTACMLSYYTLPKVHSSQHRFFIDHIALAKQGDNALGSVRSGVCLYVIIKQVNDFLLKVLQPFQQKMSCSDDYFFCQSVVFQDPCYALTIILVECRTHNANREGAHKHFQCPRMPGSVFSQIKV